MTWCQSCGEQYEGSTHNCGIARVSNDELERLRKIEVAAQGLLCAWDLFNDRKVRVGSVHPCMDKLREALGEPSDA